MLQICVLECLCSAWLTPLWNMLDIRLVTSTPFPGGIRRSEQVSALAKAVELVGDRHSLRPACGPSKPQPRDA